MDEKPLQEFDNYYVRSACAQQNYNTSQYLSYPFMPNNGCNIQNSTMCDFVYGSTQSINRSICSSNLFANYTEQEPSTWSNDTDKGHKYLDKIESIEINSKDLSPALSCSNLEMLMPDFYKTVNKDYCCPRSSVDSQWGFNFNNQKYSEYPSCSQITTCTMEKTGEEDNNLKMCSYNLSPSNDKNKQQPYGNDLQPEYNYSCSVYYPNKAQESHMINLVDINQEQCYTHNLQLNDNNIEYNPPHLSEGSNDGSDIIVEESDDEVTDFSEDFDGKFDYSTACMVCSTTYTSLGNQFYIITKEMPLSMTSQQPIFVKLVDILGTFNEKQTYLCSHCLNLINNIDHLQMQLKNHKSDLLKRYTETCKQKTFPNNNLPNEQNKVVVTNRTKNKFKTFCGLHHFKCRLCKKKLSIEQIYRYHMTKHKLKNRYLCELCGKRFSQHSHFKTHLKRHETKIHGRQKPITAFPCTICKKLFRTKSRLKDHENYCMGILPNRCKYTDCTKKFSTVSKLRNHVKHKHEKKFVAICSICNIGFIKQSDYKLHKVSHSTEKKFHCTKCDKSYKTLSNLNFHLKSHNRSLPHKCSICNKDFMRKEYLEAHLNNHMGVKNYACQFCDKKFVSQKNLDAHLKYHEGLVKTKICTICNKQITSGFEEHLRIHANLREFQCDACELKFNTKGALAKHRKRKH